MGRKWGVWGRAALGRFGPGSRRGCVGMGADKGKPACALPPRGRPLVEAGAKASVGVVDPVCLFLSCGVTKRVRM